VQLETGPNGEILVVDVSAPDDAVMEAAFEGKVMADEAGCVIGLWNHTEVLLKFPLCTRFDGADILLPNGKTIRIGEKATFGGGYFSGEQNRGATRVPEKCLRDETFLLHGVGVLDQAELAAAVAGYRWFGLDARAGGIESVAAESSRIDPEDPDSLPAAAVLEERADDLYFGEQGGDLIGPAFEQKLAENPDAFADPAPVGP